MRRERLFRETSKHFHDVAIRASRRLASGCYGALPAFERLLLHVQKHTDLLRPRSKCGDLPGNGRCRLIAGLLALALHHEQWLHPVESWTPLAASSWRQFAALAQHLFAAYPMPHFMASAWLETPGRRSLHQEWYKLMGRGRSIRDADLPITLTKSMAHLFTHALDHLTISQALRWAQVRGLGGNEKLARAVPATRLGKEFEHEPFWLTVLCFFVNHPKLDLVHVGPIVDFLQHQRFTTREVIRGGVLVDQPPPQPTYSMQGRTAASLLRQVKEWHERLGNDQQAATLNWDRSKINGFELIEGSQQLQNMRRWMITELLNSNELRVEGIAMRNCVATYAKKCAHKEVSIWSLKLETEHGKRSIVTIEVDLVRRLICQARRSCNDHIRDRELRIIEQWAKKERLAISAHL